MLSPPTLSVVLAQQSMTKPLVSLPRSVVSLETRIDGGRRRTLKRRERAGFSFNGGIGHSLFGHGELATSPKRIGCIDDGPG